MKTKAGFSSRVGAATAAITPAIRPSTTGKCLCLGSVTVPTGASREVCVVKVKPKPVSDGRAAEFATPTDLETVKKSTTFGRIGPGNC